jgi:hypothetical protein
MMRLSVLHHGHRGRTRLFLSLLGRRAPDYLKTLMYRPEFFGREFARITHEVLRGPSPWSVGERELFAAYTARLNQCPH